jgi:hypothetical protein
MDNKRGLETPEQAAIDFKKQKNRLTDTSAEDLRNEEFILRRLERFGLKGGNIETHKIIDEIEKDIKKKRGF